MPKKARIYIFVRALLDSHAFEKFVAERRKRPLISGMATDADDILALCDVIEDYKVEFASLSKELAATRKALERADEQAAATAQLVASVTAMEAEVKKLSKLLPDPVRTKLQPLFVRVPEDPAATKVSVAERFQNVLGILNEHNKANSEITVSFEVHKLADGSSAEVQAIYVGLAQAYFVSPTGEAGIGRPTADGWKWEPAAGAANQVLSALEILQGKQSPAFVPLPVKIQ